MHLKVTKDLLKELGCNEDNIIPVLNKCDLMGEERFLGQGAVRISALNGEGFDGLLDAILKALPPARKQLSLLFPFEKGALAALVRKNGVINSEEYTENGLLLDAVVDIHVIDEVKEFIV